MKKHLLLILIVFGFLQAKAQIALTNATLQYYTTDNVTPMEGFLTVENNNPNSVDVNIIRTILLLEPTHEETFCFGAYCYLPGTDTSLFTTPILANSTEETFKAHIDPLSHDGNDIIHYFFYDYNNPNDSASVTMEFIFNSTGINENSESTFLKFNNAVNNFALFSYQLPAETKNSRIDFYNTVGAKVKSVNLEEKQGAKVVTTNELSNGIYVLALVVNNEVSHSYKMVVTHQ